jgi:hypothetical protein
MESQDPEFAIEFMLEQGKLITKQIPKLHFWNSLNSSQGIPTSHTEINNPHPEDKKDKPGGRKWNFLVD